MRQIESPGFRSNTILGFMFVICLLMCSSVSYAQSPVNFAGVWVQDTTKSDDFYKAFGVVYTITQTAQTFDAKQTFTVKGSNESVINDYSFTLDGKVKNVKTEYGTENNTAKWSADKKILTTRSTIKYGSDDVGLTETYSLSENGLVLTAVKKDIIEGTTPVKMVFNKKK
jgi:hypothetical protein